LLFNLRSKIISKCCIGGIGEKKIMEKRLFRGKIQKIEKKSLVNFLAILVLFLGIASLPKMRMEERTAQTVNFPLEATIFKLETRHWENFCQKSSGLCLELEKERKIANQKTILYADILVGHPMEEMAEILAGIDSETARFLIAIAKKESNWGKHSPEKNGETCYNYWGYRGTYNQTASGYSCFDSKEQAIQVVGERVGELLAQGIDTPEEMLVWKCGSSCQGHNSKDVAKWVSDVKMVLRSINS